MNYRRSKMDTLWFAKNRLDALIGHFSRQEHSAHFVANLVDIKKTLEELETRVAELEKKKGP